VFACLLLSLLVTSGRELIGNQAATQGVTVVPSANFSPVAQLVSLPQGFAVTLAALPVFLASLARDAGTMGVVWLWLGTLFLFSAWHLVARLQRWPWPSLGVVAFLALQFWGMATYIGYLLPPARRIRTNARAWAFGVQTARGNGILSPQQQLARLHERGVRGVCLGDRMPLATQERQVLQAANPDVLVVNGAANVWKYRFLVVGARESASLDLRYLERLKRSGTLWFPMRGWFPLDEAPTRSGVLAQTPADAKPGETNLADASQSGELRSWTLLPVTARTVPQTLAALKSGQTAVAFGAPSSAWNDLTRGQKINVVLWTWRFF
jgi:hypothetical protein